MEARLMTKVVSVPGRRPLARVFSLGVAAAIASVVLMTSAEAGDRPGWVDKRLERRYAKPDRHNHGREIHVARHASAPARHDHGHFRRDQCGCGWVYREGHTKTVYETVREQGCHERVWVPACYETRKICGVRIQILVTAGHYKSVYKPGCVKKIEKRVWVPGGWVLEARCCNH